MKIFAYNFHNHMKLYHKGKLVTAKEGSIADQVQKKFRTTFRWYCEDHGLSYDSLIRGYVSKKAAKVLKKDGISFEIAEKVTA